jgi:hypothetical protein
VGLLLLRCCGGGETRGGNGHQPSTLRGVSNAEHAEEGLNHTLVVDA